MTDVDIAIANVDAFEAEAWTGVAWKLDRQSVLIRLRDLLRHPDRIDQRGLNACAPAVFFRAWLARDPIGAAAFTCKLLRDGSASIGSLIVAPSWKLLGQDYAALRAATDAAHPHATPDHTDWMLLSGLRDSENIWFDYAGEPYTIGDQVAGLTLPSTLASWFSATNLYSSVQNDTSVVALGSVAGLLQLIPTSNTDTVLFINTPAIFDLHLGPAATLPQGNLFAIPNHYVLMTAPFVESNDQAWLDIDVWSWGRTYKGWQGVSRFATNYFGYIRATT